MEKKIKWFIHHGMIMKYLLKMLLKLEQEKL